MRSDSPRIPTLDLFRGIAIACVFLHHCLQAAFGRPQLPWSGWTRDFSFSPLIPLYPLTLGWWGVSLLFVVSGFSIHLSANQRAQEGIRGYFTRRFFRLYPPYLAALLFFALIWPWTRVFPQSEDAALQIASHALLVHNFARGTFFEINPSFWSIAIGAQLYLIYPLLLLCVRQWSWRKTIVYFAIAEATLRLNFGMYFWITAQHPPAWLAENPLVFWFSWSLGAMLAEAHVRKKAIPLADSSPWIWAIAFLVTGLVKPLSDLGFFVGAILAANLLARELTAHTPMPAIVRDPRWKQYLRAVGLWSFSIYLVHEPLVDAFSYEVYPYLVRFPGAQWMVFLASAGLWFVIVPVGAFLYRRIELPSIALGKRFLLAQSAQ